jgi:phage-related protein
MRTIQFFKTVDGASPVEEFIDTLSSRVAQKVVWTFGIVKELPMVSEQYLKKLDGTDDIWEIRVALGGTAVRFLGFWEAGSLIILTNGFEKKSQKTPRAEIKIALQRKKEYQSRKNHG